MITRAQYNEAVSILKRYRDQLNEHLNVVNMELKSIPSFYKLTKESLIGDTDLSVRCINILIGNCDELGLKNKNTLWETKIKDLSMVSKKSFLECRNAGKQTLKELLILCSHFGIEMLP